MIDSLAIWSAGLGNMAGAWVSPIRCPRCGREATFDPVGNDYVSGGKVEGADRLGFRRCPSVQCRAIVLVAYEGSDLRIQYPRERHAIQADRIPAAILSAYREAVECDANECYRAAAMLIRRTLEELCDDKQAPGNTLAARIRSLSSAVTISKWIPEAMETLKLLGNDAAHVQLKDFDKIGKDEVSVALGLLAEILRAIYQQDLLHAKLLALKK